MDISNDPELNGKYLGTVSQDFVKISDTLKEASYQIRKRGFSEFPIFPVCKIKQPVDIAIRQESDQAPDSFGAVIPECPHAVIDEEVPEDSELDSVN